MFQIIMNSPEIDILCFVISIESLSKKIKLIRYQSTKY